MTYTAVRESSYTPLANVNWMRRTVMNLPLEFQEDLPRRGVRLCMHYATTAHNTNPQVSIYLVARNNGAGAPREFLEKVELRGTFTKSGRPMNAREVQNAVEPILEQILRERCKTERALRHLR